MKCKKSTLNASGYEAEGFEDDEAFRLAVERAEPDLIILDIMLPDEDGLSILKKLKAVIGTHGIPVIMLTAKSTEYNKVLGLDTGSDDYVAKLVRIYISVIRPHITTKMATFSAFNVKAMNMDWSHRPMSGPISMSAIHFVLPSHPIPLAGIAV